MTRRVRAVLDPAQGEPPGLAGIRHEGLAHVVMDCQLESQDCYDWLTKFLGDKLVFVERWEDGQEG